MPTPPTRPPSSSPAPATRSRTTAWPTLSPTAPTVILMYSGGKDSLVAADLAIQHYGVEHCLAIHQSLVLGLDYAQAVLQHAARRWPGLRTAEVLHWMTSGLLRDGTFCPPRPTLPRLTITDLERTVRQTYQGQWCVYGYRADESLERRGMLSSAWPQGVNQRRGAVAPIAWWSLRDIRGYLRVHQLPLPRLSASGNRPSGLDLTPAVLHWMRDHWPADYRRILKVFPYARAQADRWPAILAAKHAARKARTPQARTPGRAPAADQPPDV